MQTILTEKVDRESEYDKFEAKDEKDLKKKEKKEKEKEKKQKKSKAPTIDVVIDTEVHNNFDDENEDVFKRVEKKEPKPKKEPQPKKESKPKKELVDKNSKKKKTEEDKINAKQLMKQIDKHKYLLEVLNNTDLDKDKLIESIKKELNTCLDLLKKFSVTEKMEL